MSDSSGVEHLLITGYPGLLARRMVEHLLAVGAPSIEVLVPPSLEDDARLKAWATTGRVRWMIGDVGALDLGLSGAEYRALADRVRWIYHLAQELSPTAGRAAAERVNVAGVREVLELGRSCSQLRGIGVCSSALVSGDRTGVVYEADLKQGQRFRSPAEETLALAEAMARRSMDRLPISVARPTQIVGDSVSGEIDRFEGPYWFILAVVAAPPDFRIPLPDRAGSPMHMIPVDYAVSAMHHVWRKPEARGKTFHLNGSERLTVRQVFELVAQSGGKRIGSGVIPTGVARALMKTPGIHLLSKSPRALFDQIASPVFYDSRIARALLADLGSSCPRFETYVDRLVAYAKARLAEGRLRAGEDGVPV